MNYIDNKISQADSQLHWFWRVTTKWYFFPVFYAFLAFLIAAVFIPVREGYYSNLLDFFETFGFTLMLMPFGIAFFISPNLDKISMGGVFIAWGTIIFWLISMILVPYFKLRKNKVIRWLIFTTLIIMILSFAGRVGIILSGQPLVHD